MSEFRAWVGVFRGTAGPSTIRLCRGSALREVAYLESVRGGGAGVDTGDPDVAERELGLAGWEIIRVDVAPKERP